MSVVRQTLKKRFGTPEGHPRLRVIASTVGPGKARLLALIEETQSISKAARQMKISYKRAWQLIDAMNACFREPVVESMTGGTKGGGSRLSSTGKKVLALYEAIYAKSLKAGARELRRLHGLLKTCGQGG